MAAIRRLQGGQTAAEVARALEVHPTELYRWRQELDIHGERAFQGVGKKRAEEGRVAELERKIGQQILEIDFLKRALQHVEEQRRYSSAGKSRRTPAGFPMSQPYHRNLGFNGQ